MIVNAKVKNIRCRTIIGVFDWERENKQEIIINFSVEYDAQKVIDSDNLNDALNYGDVAEQIIENVENSEFYILEKLVSFVLDVIMEHPKALKAVVEVDKPAPLARFADSVSVTGSRVR